MPLDVMVDDRRKEGPAVIRARVVAARAQPAARQAEAGGSLYALLTGRPGPISLETHDGYFMSAIDGAGGGMSACSTSIGSWETFQVHLL